MNTVALGDIVDFYSGGTPSKAKPELWEGDVPWFSAKDMKRWHLSDSTDHISEEVFRATPLRKLPPGTVTLVVRGMILAHTVPISILDVDAAINQDLKALIPRQPLEPSYLAAMLRAQHASILSRVSTAAHGTKKLDSRVLEEIQIPFPPLDEQRRVAAILDHADALRVKRRQVLDHIDALTHSVFQAMFGDVVADGSVGDVADIQSGLQVSAKRSSLPIEVPYLRVANVHRGRLDLTEIKTMRATGPEVVRTHLDQGDLLFVEGHANPLEVGRVAVWSGAVDGCVHQNHLIRARLDPTRMLPAFASAWLNSTRGAAHFRRAGKTTSGLNTISSATVRSAPVPLVPLHDQHRFVAAVDRAHRASTIVHSALAADDELFGSLQSRAFRGEL